MARYMSPLNGGIEFTEGQFLILKSLPSRAEEARKELKAQADAVREKFEDRFPESVRQMIVRSGESSP